MYIVILCFLSCLLISSLLAKLSKSVSHKYLQHITTDSPLNGEKSTYITTKGVAVLTIIIGIAWIVFPFAYREENLDFEKFTLGGVLSFCILPITAQLAYLILLFYTSKNPTSLVGATHFKSGFSYLSRHLPFIAMHLPIAITFMFFIESSFMEGVICITLSTAVFMTIYCINNYLIPLKKEQS